MHSGFSGGGGEGVRQSIHTHKNLYYFVCPLPGDMFFVVESPPIPPNPWRIFVFWGGGWEMGKGEGGKGGVVLVQ